MRIVVIWLRELGLIVAAIRRANGLLSAAAAHVANTRLKEIGLKRAGAWPGGGRSTMAAAATAAVGGAKSESFS